MDYKMEAQMNGRQHPPRLPRTPPNDSMTTAQTTAFKRSPVQRMTYQEEPRPRQNIALIILGLLHIFVGVAITILHICMIAEEQKLTIWGYARFVNVHTPLWCGAWFILVGSFGISTASWCQPDPVATTACMRQLFLVLSSVSMVFAVILIGVSFAAVGIMEADKHALHLGLSITIGVLGIIEIIICIISVILARPIKRDSSSTVNRGGYPQYPEQPRAYVAQMPVTPEPQRPFVPVTPATTPRLEPRQDHSLSRLQQKLKHHKQLQQQQQQHHHHHHHHPQQPVQQPQLQQQHMGVISQENVYPGAYVPPSQAAKYQVYTFPRVTVAPSRPLPGMWMEN